MEQTILKEDEMSIILQIENKALKEDLTNLK